MDTKPQTCMRLLVLVMKRPPKRPDFHGLAHPLNGFLGGIYFVIELNFIVEQVLLNLSLCTTEEEKSAFMERFIRGWGGSAYEDGYNAAIEFYGIETE